MKVRFSKSRRVARAGLIGLLATATVALGAVAPAGAASKRVVKVMLIAPISSPVVSQPTIPEGAEAAAAALLKGKNGVDIQIDVCNDNFDANTAAACARTAVANKYVAVVGGLTLFATGVFPILEAAKIPYIGNFPASPIDFQSPMAFPLEAGTFTSVVGGGLFTKPLNCKKLGLIYIDSAATANTKTYMEAAVQQTGATIVSSNAVGNTVADYSPAVAAAIGAGAECLAAYFSAASMAKVVTAVSQSSKPKMPVISTVQGVPPSIVTALGPLAEGLPLTSNAYSPDSTQSAAYRNDLKAYKPTAAVTIESQAAWSSYQAFGQVLKNVKGTVTSAKILKALPKTTVTLPTYPAPISFANNKAFPDYPHLFNPTGVFYTVKNGQYVLSDPPSFDATKALKKAFG